MKREKINLMSESGFRNLARLSREAYFMAIEQKNKLRSSNNKIELLEINAQKMQPLYMLEVQYKKFEQLVNPALRKDLRGKRTTGILVQFEDSRIPVLLTTKKRLSLKKIQSLAKKAEPTIKKA